ncbi:MAG: hypothetical protein Q7O66_07215 [Dehalococcoidia bacterium]|nr:hypothetical protein [Dehalococcoidia bacterium]
MSMANRAIEAIDELETVTAQRDALLEAIRAFAEGFADGSIKWAMPRRADSDPYHRANVLMCAALSLIAES